MALFANGAAAANENAESLQWRVQELRDEIGHTQRLYEKQIEALERRIVDLEKSEKQNRRQDAAGLETASAGGKRHTQHPSLQWSLAGLSVIGGSNAGQDELPGLQGGTHDPGKNGFTLQTLSLAVHAQLGRGLEAKASLVTNIEPDGERVTELGQAFLQAHGLARDVSLLAGNYFLEFGEENIRHPDDWDFVDVPVMISRLFGSDKLRSTGARLSWEPPLPWMSKIYFGAHNPDGETAASFLFEEGEQVAGHVLRSREVDGLGELLYSLKWSHRLPVSASGRIRMGLSALFGPNATGDSTDTQIYGFDFQWSEYGRMPMHQAKFDWRTELLFRRYEAGDPGDSSREILRDYGVFSQAVWRLDGRWVSGLRAEFGNGNADNADDPLRDNRKRLSANLTRRVGSAVRLRMQYNRDWAEHLPNGSADSLWLQLAFRAGAHQHE